MNNMYLGKEIQIKIKEIIREILEQNLSDNDVDEILQKIENKKPIEDINILQLSDKYSTTLAHYMAMIGYDFPLDRVDFLKLADCVKWTVAHEMAYRNYIFPADAMEILSLATDSGWTVAHEMAKNGYRFPEDRKDILMLKDEYEWTVAHEMAKNGYFFHIDNDEILQLCDNKNITVAWLMVQNGFYFPEKYKKYWFMQDNLRTTLIEMMFKKEYHLESKNKEILMLKYDDNKNTIAHLVARYDKNFDFDLKADKDILLLENIIHVRVFDNLAKYNKNFIEKINLKNINEENIEYFIRIIEVDGVRKAKITEALEALFLKDSFAGKIIHEKDFYRFIRLCTKFVDKIDENIYVYFIKRTNIQNIIRFLYRFDFYEQYLDATTLSIILDFENIDYLLTAILSRLIKHKLCAELVRKYWLNNPKITILTKNKKIDILLKYCLYNYDSLMNNEVEKILESIELNYKTPIERIFAEIKAEDFLRYLYSNHNEFVFKIVELMYEKDFIISPLIRTLHTIFDIISDQIPVHTTYIFSKIEAFLRKIGHVSASNFTKVLLLDNEFINASIDLLSSLPELEDVKNNFVQNISQIKKTICDVF